MMTDFPSLHDTIQEDELNDIELAIKEAIDAGEKLWEREWRRGKTPEFFDHRLVLLNPARWMRGHWFEAAANLVRVLPLKSRLLDLCCGDGFYDRYVFSERCYEIIAVDRNTEALSHARNFHGRDNIQYVQSDILGYEPEGLFDAVFMRSAIEHFSESAQQTIFRKIADWLKPTGYFVGDTPLADKTRETFVWHDFEWDSYATAHRALSRVFEEVQIHILESTERTTVYWQCRML